MTAQIIAPQNGEPIPPERMRDIWHTDRGFYPLDPSHVLRIMNKAGAQHGQLWQRLAESSREDTEHGSRYATSVVNRPAYFARLASAYLRATERAELRRAQAAQQASR